MRRYRGRVLVLFGAQDVFGAPDWSSTLAHELPRARFTRVLLPHAGHLPWLESPRALPLVARFLATR